MILILLFQWHHCCLASIFCLMVTSPLFSSTGYLGMGNRIFWLTGVVPFSSSTSLYICICVLVVFCWGEGVVWSDWGYWFWLEFKFYINHIRFGNNFSFTLISRFDGRALLDFIRDSDSRHFRAQQKTEEEEELEEFVNFERYRDLIKHRRRGCRYFFDFFDHVLNSWTLSNVFSPLPMSFYV